MTRSARRPRSLSAALLALPVVAALVLAGCAPAADIPRRTATYTADGTAPPLEGSFTIDAAASLKAAFDELATEFEAANPGVDVQPITYDGSSTLATQIIEGAPVDVFASADENNMQKVVDADLASDPQLFATNTLVIIVPAGNPAGIDDLADLADPAVTVDLCAPEVPCGAASQTLLSNEGVSVTPVSQEQKVTDVLTKVAAGEVDAGLVYVTDAQGRDDVEAIVPEGAADVVNRYPIVALDGSANPDAAAAFVAFVLSDDGRAVLDRLGFGAP